MPRGITCKHDQQTTGGGRWIRTTEGVSQQIYSLPPLAAWVSLRQGAHYFHGERRSCQRLIHNEFEGLDVEAEVQHVAFLDHVFLAFQP